MPSAAVALHNVRAAHVGAVQQYTECAMTTFSMPLQLAPTALSQSILPNWSFNLFNVNLGTTSNAQVEEKALEQVGSYGKQIGHLAEALEVVIQRLHVLGGKDLSQEDRDALRVFLGDVATVRMIKERLK
jgi:hypothetical protein